jgi:hypothetical protein
MGKIKFKNSQLKFKLTPGHMETGIITGETKLSVFSDFENEKFTVCTKDFSYDMKMFRVFLQKMEGIKNTEETEAIFLEKNNNLVIKITSSLENSINWNVSVNKTISDNNYTKLNIGFTTPINSLNSIIEDISYFLVNPTSF